MNTSNTNAHTPGPWNVSGCRANDDNLICHGDENETSPIIAQVLSDGGALPRLANARLIAAAPRLLDALKRLCSKFGVDDSGTPRDWTEWREARDTIAKAEGSAEK